MYLSIENEHQCIRRQLVELITVVVEENDAFVSLKFTGCIGAHVVMASCLDVRGYSSEIWA